MDNKQSPEKWHVLYTAPRAEKQVDKRLQQQGIQTFLPLHLSPRRWSDRVKWVEMPLFPSYIFVQTTEYILRSLPTVPGVVRIVFYNNRPALIKNSEIKAIRTFLEQAREKELQYTVDDEVLIACGPLKNISGKITKIGKRFLVLHMEELGITVSVKIDQIIKK
ncbi:MAG: UpxY family transcription antiterminator [Prevotellaceae bacterium]|jgi:transcription antitermination factor NusG|nr:UpxY family transcription antiterminator [Prevotellaceae bacterium]